MFRIIAWASLAMNVVTFVIIYELYHVVPGQPVSNLTCDKCMDTSARDRLSGYMQCAAKALREASRP